jgi:mono/diheme cytochrome c family protein
MRADILQGLAGLAAVLVFAGTARAQESETLPDGEGKALVATVCSTCHGLKALFIYNGDDRKWEILVHEMVAFGAQVTPQERDTIMKYLKATFSTDRGSSPAASAPLPAGKGQEIVQGSCGACHGVALIARKRADRAGWESILKRHTSEERVTLSPEQLETLLSYLSTNLGTSSGAAAKPPAQNRR